ncbi:uncharacterized protein LOC142529128 isoform X3 [Primulina tabacum]|uniref:uncharacterized protein LOC142529128 isoform X3 n=1 Tax=Primulina tabacum TaxID=48773 RepID=UPI003F59959C
MEFLYSCVEVDSIERGPNFAGFITMRDISEGMLRMMCDKYQTIRDSKYATWVTRLHGCNRELVKDLAELALDSYNQTEQKNFKLEKVCKLNRKNVFFCMTFRARNAEIDECRLFRGVVVFDDVLLCEIMFFRMVIRLRVMEIMLPHHFEARKLTTLARGTMHPQNLSLQGGGSD